jgi:ribosomal protein S18 acetylase RimI-like enzyme
MAGKISDIQRAQVADLPLVMETFMACTSEMRKNGIQQWDYTYPEPGQVLNDIKAENVYVIKNQNRCIATVTLDDQQDRQYENIKWNYTDGKTLVIHRMAVHPVAQREGYGNLLCNFSLNYGKMKGYDNIRLDAYSGNLASNKMYIKHGFEVAEGFCFFHGNLKPFICYEATLLKK